jgi:hypothetical protein
MDWREIRELVELVVLLATILGFVLSPLIISWGKKKLGIMAHDKRIQALELEDQKKQLDQERFNIRLSLVEAEVKQIEKMDRRQFKMAVLLSQVFPEEAKNVNLLGENDL